MTQVVLPKTVDDVLSVAAGFYRVSVKALKSAHRYKGLARARAVAMYIAREHTRASFPEIGRAFKRHHTTALLAHRTIDWKLRSDSGLRDEVGSIELLLEGKAQRMEARP